MKYLLYPATDDQSVSFYQRQSKEMQNCIIASASLDPEKEQLRVYKNYKQLPNVFENAFKDRILTLIGEEDVAAVLCSNDFVAREIMRRLPNMSVVMIGDGLISLIDRYIGFEKAAQVFVNQFEKKYKKNPIITPLQIVEILYSVSCLFGESHTSKVFHFIECLEQCPKEGTVIEVGALMGKQSVALALLGQIYSYKELLIVDPWSVHEAPQHDAHKTVTDFPRSLKWDYIKKICEAHIRNHRYQNFRIIQNTIENEAVNIKDVSFIHLDGNHDYKAVVTQLDLLKGKMLPGGCILCDDYLWPIGDSVKRAVDEFAEKNEGSIKHTVLLDENLAVYFR